jgi:hypothetical protein
LSPISNSGSIPQTFSPHTRLIPLIAHQADPADRGADSKVVPIFARDIRTAEGARENRHLHLHLIANPVFGFGIDIWKRGFIGIRLNPLGAQGIAHNIQMRIIHRVVLIGTGGNTAKGFRIKKLPTPESGFEYIAISLATIQTPAADTGLGCNVTRSVSGLKCIVCIRPVKIHRFSPCFRW